MVFPWFSPAPPRRPHTPPRRRADAHPAVAIRRVQLGGAEAAQDGAAGEPLHRELRRIDGHGHGRMEVMGVLAGMRILHVYNIICIYTYNIIYIYILYYWFIYDFICIGSV